MTIGDEKEADAIFQEEENAKVKADADARLARAHALAQSKADAVRTLLSSDASNLHRNMLSALSALAMVL